MDVSLSQLLRDAGLSREVASDPVITGISEDSRSVQPGYVFVAVSGTRESGQRFIDDAIGRGAAAIVAETPISVDVPLVQVSNGREALADLAAAFFGYPSRQLAALGVTGTDGKTTTSFLLAGILKSAGLPTGLITTVQTRTSAKPLANQGRLTTPSAPFVQSALSDMVAGEIATWLWSVLVMRWCRRDSGTSVSTPPPSQTWPPTMSSFMDPMRLT